MRVRYDSEADILYIFVKEGSIKDTMEVSDDLFVEYDENNHIAGIERGASQKKSAARIDELCGACNQSYDGLEIIKLYSRNKESFC